ncbi:MAG TPA: TssQ family T6SS-associated lipoprotein [Burkholderiales bacterium]|nr:TssQ family T6SS-associated lipoprotein [Burkholderiales bacterium]
MNRLLHSILVAFMLILAGCNTAPMKSIGEMFQGGKAEQDLSAGIDKYNDGSYNEAARLLQASLDEGLSAKSDQVKAHKYLAFIHCGSGREAQCRNEFRAALKIDPSFELAANEAGHPIWGPVFRSVKGRNR